MRNRKVVRLTESKLKRMIAEAVDETLNEYGETHYGQYMLGRLAARKGERGMNGPIGQYARAASDRDGDGSMGYFLDGLKNQRDFQNAVDDSNERDIKNFREKIKDQAQYWYDRTPWAQEELAKQRERENRKKYRSSNQNDKRNSSLWRKWFK